MNRAARRRLNRLQERLVNRQTPEDFDAFLEEAQRNSDPTNPLRYQGGFVHVGCGGDAERPSNFGAGAYCTKCSRTVPWEETERA